MNSAPSTTNTTLTGHSISIRNVSKTYKKTTRPAVDDVSLEIIPGEFLTFLGPSGSGKTTLLSLIAGLSSLDTGEILIAGQDVSRQKSHQRNLGVVFQQYALFPHMTVEKNIGYGLSQRGVSKNDIRDKVKSILKVVELEQFADRLPAELSGGQQQRVALARAVVYEPRALLLDEPLSALDKRLREQLQMEISRIHRQLGLTFIFVTHDQQEAMSMSDRIAVFDNGRIQQVGTPEELYENPANLFVANFLGDSNRFGGTVAGSNFVWEECSLTLGDSAFVAGDNATLMVRPEKVSLVQTASAVPDGHNRLPAVLDSLAFAGPTKRAVVRYETGEPGLVVCPSDFDLSAHPGDEVYVHWDPSHQKIIY